MAQLITKPISRQFGKDSPPAPVDEVVFKATLSENVDWKPFAAFPPSARLAVVAGQPSQPGLYTIRVKVPHGVKLMPHRHREHRIYTVISGVFYIGLATNLTVTNWSRIRPVPLSFFPAILPIITGPSPENTSRKYRRSGRLASNTSNRRMIREIRLRLEMNRKRVHDEQYRKEGIA